MRRIRTERRRPSHDRWLVSYADFITLLFAFFVVMYSAAQLDKRRAGKLATAIQSAFSQHGSLPPKPAEVGGLSASGVPANLPVGNTEENEFITLKGRIETALAEEITAGDVVVRQTGEGLVVSLREIGFFDSGSDEIKRARRARFRGLRKFCARPTTKFELKGIPTMSRFITAAFLRTGICQRHELLRPSGC